MSRRKSLAGFFDMFKCEKQVNAKARFDKRSFRWVKTGKLGRRAKVLIGCPKGHWEAKAKRCAVGTMAYKVIVEPVKGRCETPAKAVSKYL